MDGLRKRVEVELQEFAQESFREDHWRAREFAGAGVCIGCKQEFSSHLLTVHVYGVDYANICRELLLTYVL